MKRQIKPIDPHLCRVCGYHDADYPWGEDGLKPSFAICACCGTEFGNDDSSPKGVRQARAKWMENGYPWAVPAQKPQDWQAHAQLGRLKQTLWDPWA